MTNTNPGSAIEVVAVASLKPMASNPNTHPDSQIESLARSIRTWGIPLPILVDENQVVLAGNGTLAGAIKAGLTHVPVCRAIGWTDQKKREYAVLDNKLRQMSNWDDAVLKSEVSAIVDSEYLESIGYADDEIDKLIAETSPFSVGGDGASSGVKMELVKFGKEKLRITSDDKSNLLSLLDNHILKTGSNAGFVAAITEKVSKKHLDL
jgi:hypothetical protein